MNVLATVANSCCCNLSYPLSQGLVIAAATVVVHRATLHHQTAATAQTNSVGVQQISHSFPFLDGPQNFFRMTSWSISLSRLKSATRRRSR